MNNNVLSRMKELVAIINKHNYNYYVLDKPTISDAEWDELYDELLKLEKASGTILPDSPSQKIGGEIISKFKKIKHTQPIYSLEKCTDIKDLSHWMDNVKKVVKNPSFFAEYKFDGLAIVLAYDNGKLEYASTRGNGLIGEDVTAQIKTIRSVPLSIPYDKKVIFRGECVMKLSELEKYNKTHDEQLKNARNAAAGGLRTLDTSITKERNLDVVAYDIIEIEGKEFNTQKEMYEFIKSQGFIPTLTYFEFNTEEEAQKIINHIDAERKVIDVLTDGIVFKLNSIKDRKILGFTAKFPKFMIAYKFKPDITSTKLIDVIWQVGRTGKITPNAVLEPVDIAGATVSRATLNNFNDIQKKKLKINTNVFIHRSNEVIPEILEVAEYLEDARDIEKIEYCPSCHSKLIEKGANLYCENIYHCKEQIIQRISHFCSRDAMNIEGINEKTVEAMIDTLNVKSICDLYALTDEDLYKLEFFKDKKVSNLLNGIKKSKSPALNKFIYAIGILGVGKKTAVDLAKRFKTFDNFQKASRDDLTQIDGIGEVVADNILEYFRDDINNEILFNLFSSGLKVEEMEENLNTKFENLTFVITGTMEKYSRNELTDIIVNNGGRVSSSVSKNTNYIVYGVNPGSKFEKGVNLGIKMLTEVEFEKLLEV